MKVSIQTVSMSPTLGRKDKNLKRMREEAGRGADLMVFPELALTGYSMRDDVFWMAEELNGDSVETVKKIAADTGSHMLFGMAEKHMDRIYNSAVLVAPNGMVWCYRKHHPVNFGPFEEARYFSPGKKLDVAETSIGRIGMTICYDIFFPELTKSLALKGADVVVNIAASPHTTGPFFEKVLPARAIESTVFMVFSNNVGVYNNMMFWGGGRILDPRGGVKAFTESFVEDSAISTVDLRDLEYARRMRPTLADTPSTFLRWMEDQG